MAGPRRLRKDDNKKKNDPVRGGSKTLAVVSVVTAVGGLVYLGGGPLLNYLASLKPKPEMIRPVAPPPKPAPSVVINSPEPVPAPPKPAPVKKKKRKRRRKPAPPVAKKPPAPPKRETFVAKVEQPKTKKEAAKEYWGKLKRIGFLKKIDTLLSGKYGTEEYVGSRLMLKIRISYSPGQTALSLKSVTGIAGVESFEGQINTILAQAAKDANARGIKPDQALGETFGFTSPQRITIKAQ